MGGRESSRVFLISPIPVKKNIAPKTYKHEYINNKNKIKIKDECIMKCKGIPKKCLKSDFYETESAVEVEFDGLKRKHKPLTKDDKSKGISHFSIVNNHQKRTMTESIWHGMDFKTNEYFPYGYKHNLVNIMSKTNEEIIREVYYDPLTGFSGVNKTFQILKKQGHKISRKEIQKFIKKQEISQVNKKNIGKSGSFIPPHPLYEFHIDLI